MTAQNHTARYTAASRAWLTPCGTTWNRCSGPALLPSPLLPAPEVPFPFTILNQHLEEKQLYNIALLPGRTISPPQIWILHNLFSQYYHHCLNNIWHYRIMCAKVHSRKSWVFLELWPYAGLTCKHTGSSFTVARQPAKNLYSSLY